MQTPLYIDCILLSIYIWQKLYMKFNIIRASEYQVWVVTDIKMYTESTFYRVRKNRFNVENGKAYFLIFLFCLYMSTSTQKNTPPNPTLPDW